VNKAPGPQTYIQNIEEKVVIIALEDFYLFLKAAVLILKVKFLKIFEAIFHAHTFPP
jgi:hypothetical protein